MKAITLHQPWASLIAFGEKRYETRTWPINYRGPLAIHAGKLFRVNNFMEATITVAMVNHGVNHVKENLPYGAVICIVELIDVIPTERIPLHERRFGDFSACRFAWQLELKDVFANPIAASGKQGLWNWQPPTLKASRLECPCCTSDDLFLVDQTIDGVVTGDTYQCNRCLTYFIPNESCDCKDIGNSEPVRRYRVRPNV